MFKSDPVNSDSFESEFLTSTQQSKETYQLLISEIATLLASSLPEQACNGRNATALSALLPVDILPRFPSGLEIVMDQLKPIIANSVVVTHPHTIAHLHCPPLVSALAAEVVISGLNQSMDSFDQAPIATVLEQQMTRWLCAEAALPETADGTFTTGSSQSNYFGLLLARDAFLKSQWNWSAQRSGLHPEARRLRILCSEAAHFTVEKSASQLGLGTAAVMRVEADDKFRMKPDALRKSLEKLHAQELLPFAVVATAGTTDFGSVDSLPEIAALAQGAGAWFHVDAAYGGALLFSKLHRSQLAGIELADSLSIDFHKLFWQPIPCSVLLVRKKKHFDLIKMHADYLNPEAHDAEGIPDLVTRSLLTSRRFDALKLWISFQTLGRDKLGALIDKTIALAAHAAEVIRRTPRFQLLHEPSLSTLVFRYVPSNQAIDADRLNTQLRQELFDRGIAVVGHTRVRGRQCLKFTCMNPTITEKQLEELIRIIAKNGEGLERKLKVTEA